MRTATKGQEDRDMQSLQLRSIDTSPQRELPELRDVEAWTVPASSEDVSVCVAFCISVVEPDAPSARTQLMKRLLAVRGYSRAELAMIAQELPFDSRAAHNYGRGFNLADAERLVQEHRKYRAMLDRQMTSSEVTELCNRFPSSYNRDDFGVSGYSPRDEPLFKLIKCQNPVDQGSDDRPKLRRVSI